MFDNLKCVLIYKLVIYNFQNSVCMACDVVHTGMFIMTVSIVLPLIWLRNFRSGGRFNPHTPADTVIKVVSWWTAAILTFNTFTLNPIPHILVWTAACSRTFTFVSISVAFFWVLTVSIRCALPALAAKVLYKSYVLNSNNAAVVSVASKHNCPSVHNTSTCGCTSSRMTAD